MRGGLNNKGLWLIVSRFLIRFYYGAFLIVLYFTVKDYLTQNSLRDVFVWSMLLMCCSIASYEKGDEDQKHPVYFLKWLTEAYTIEISLNGWTESKGDNQVKYCSSRFKKRVYW